MCGVGVLCRVCVRESVVGVWGVGVWCGSVVWECGVGVWCRSVV